MSEPDKVAPRLTAQDVADAFRDAEKWRKASDVLPKGIVCGDCGERMDVGDLLVRMGRYLDRQENRDAERLRNLAARFEERANWGGNYSGAEIAAMLRGDGA